MGVIVIHAGLIFLLEKKEGNSQIRLLMISNKNIATRSFLEKVKKSMRGNLFIDLRNVYEPDRVAGFGFRHISVGRPTKTPTQST